MAGSDAFAAHTTAADTSEEAATATAMTIMATAVVDDPLGECVGQTRAPPLRHKDHLHNLHPLPRRSISSHHHLYCRKTARHRSRSNLLGRGRLEGSCLSSHLAFSAYVVWDYGKPVWDSGQPGHSEAAAAAESKHAWSKAASWVTTTAGAVHRRKVVTIEHKAIASRKVAVMDVTSHR